jgi:hypothetical protein
VTDELNDWARSVGHDMWPGLAAATFRPLSEARPALAAELIERLAGRLTDAGLAEAEVDQALADLVLEEATLPSSAMILRIAATTATATSSHTGAWEGTDDEACGSVDAFADSLLHDD